MSKHERTWSLQEAKAKFSEVIKLAQAGGTQIVTVRGKAAAKIVPASDDQESTSPTIRDFLKALQSCPVQDFEVPRVRTFGKFRNVDL